MRDETPTGFITLGDGENAKHVPIFGGRKDGSRIVGGVLGRRTRTSVRRGPQGPDTLLTPHETKGHKVVGHDSMSHDGQYDRVVMNPAFEGGYDADEVRRVFEHNLKPDGKLAAVMGAGLPSMARGERWVVCQTSVDSARTRGGRESNWRTRRNTLRHLYRRACLGAGTRKKQGAVRESLRRDA